jgi:trk system potassium uptake protein
MGARLATVPLLVVLMGVTGLLMLIPASKAFIDGQPEIGRDFVYSSLICVVLASLLGLALGGRQGGARRFGLFPTLASVYLLVPAVMAVPLAEALDQFTFADAWFEMISGFTTTGATLIDFPQRVPPAAHLWRGLSGWLGGLFILSAATALLAPLRLGGYELIYRSPGDQTRAGLGAASAGARLQAHALVVLPIYTLLTGALWLVLVMLSVDGFTALMLAMATLSTSGILPGETLGPIGLGAELAIFVMLIVALSRRFLPGHGRRRRVLYRDPELVTALLIVALVTLFVAARHWGGAFEMAESQNLPALGGSVWGAAFTGLSFLTTTGFVNQDWIASRAWSGLTPPGMVLMGLALLGGGVATTAGGIKLLRIYALARLSKAEMERMIYPSLVVGGNQYDRFLSTTGARSAWLFVMAFTLTAIAVVALLLLVGMSLETALIFAVAGLTNTGPLVRVAGDLPLYWVLISDASRLVLAGAMILGRLEILVLLALILERTQRN